MSWNLTRDIGAAFGGVLSQLGLTEPVAGDLNNEEVWRICAQCCEDVYYLFKPAGNAVGSAHEDLEEPPEGGITEGPSHCELFPSERLVAMFRGSSDGELVWEEGLNACETGTRPSSGSPRDPRDQLKRPLRRAKVG